MIKQGRPPLACGMTSRALGIPAVFGKLSGVRILMTSLALLGRGLEQDTLHRQFEVGRLVAQDARHGAMRARQRVGRRGVVEAPDVAPRASAVAGFAPERPSVRPAFRHPLRELATMRIEMAIPAGQIIKVVSDGRGGSGKLSGLVTIGTGYGKMSAHEGKPRLFVPRQRVG